MGKGRSGKGGGTNRVVTLCESQNLGEGRRGKREREGENCFSFFGSGNVLFLLQKEGMSFFLLCRQSPKSPLGASRGVFFSSFIFW